MSEPIKRRRRRRIGNSSHSDFSLISLTETEAGTSTESTDTESKNEHPPLNAPYENVDSINTHQVTIGRIQKEINEDRYHHELDEPHYSNDSHDWSDHLESAKARLLAFFRNV